jgi:hypothetical protein
VFNHVRQCPHARRTSLTWIFSSISLLPLLLPCLGFPLLVHLLKELYHVLRTRQQAPVYHINAKLEEVTVEPKDGYPFKRPPSPRKKDRKRVKRDVAQNEGGYKVATSFVVYAEDHEEAEYGGLSGR